MREALFKKQNLEKWKRYEEEWKAKDSDALAERYIELTDDLAYAQTFYPQSNTTIYLNNLTSKLFQRIYVNKKESYSRIWLFWKTELPHLFAEVHPTLFLAFVWFGISALIGACSAAYDESFIRLILGDAYVDMTLDNIQKGDPLAVYGQEDMISMFFAITLNNIHVAFLTFVAGIFCSVGTAYLLVYNGVMLGCFQYFCYQQGFLKVSLLTIWLHGTIEISSIMIAGCAGFLLGNSLLFPGTYTRLDALKQAANKALKISIGLVPFFVIAGFIESFVTRQHLSTLPSLSIIVASLVLIVWYFVLYPWQLKKASSKV